MPVNETLSQFSDWSYNTATAIYLLAMVLFLVEQSFGQKGRLAAERTRQPAGQLVGAGESAADGTPGAPQDAPPVATPRSVARAERFGGMGATILVLGALLHLAALVLRGFATGRVPWGNMYEFIMMLCFVAVVTWIVLMRRHPVRHLSAFVLLPVVILLFVGGTALYTTAVPVQPALQSYWLVIHVSAAASSSGIFLVPGVASVLYLIRAAHERNPLRFARFGGYLPAKEVLDRIAYRATVFAFPLFTFGVITGAIWAEAAWGRFWGWDPKETVSFIAWVVYAAYLHARATAGWRGERAAAINIVGFSVPEFHQFFNNLVIAGLHSYAGVG
jgi:cytochrome c-type biogenesis protein CcsB